MTSWDVLKTDLKATFVNHHRRERAEDLLRTRTKGPNESVTSFVEDVLRLSARADPQATEEKKLRILMRGVRDDIFGGLVRNPPTTVDAFVTEATNIERALQARASHYQRQPSVTATALLSGENAPGTDIREIIREVVREELRKLLPTTGRPPTISIAEAVREEVHRALQPEVPVTTVAPEEPTLSYAAMARRPPQASRQATAPPRRDVPTPQYPRRQEDQAHVLPERPAPRKTDVWRTADRRPLCYHCGEADHVYRRCPYRRLGLRGFHPNDPRPRYGERPREIDEYLRRPQSPEPASRREFRSPSPRRPASPMHRPRRESLSPLAPRRGN
ncbi:uncharacterized protein ISCGN_027145 [Ixodes scapularis]